MELYNEILCCTADDLIAVSSESIYRHMTTRNQVNRLRRACRGKKALIELESIPYDLRSAIIAMHGGGLEQKARSKEFTNEIQLDMDAVSFFANYKPAGKSIKADQQRILVNEASILNTVQIKLQKHLKRQSSGSKLSDFWRNAVRVIPIIKDDWPHKLPSSEKYLKQKFKSYMEDGYRSLVSAAYGNINSRVVNPQLEELLRFITAQSWKPNHIEVHKSYLEFIKGVKILVNADTGEVYAPQDYEPISESTVRNYMNKWANAVGLEKKRSNSRIAYNAKHRSYADLYVKHSGAILSMDDRDMPFKLKGTNKRVVGYFTADACSGAIIGWAFAKPKMHPDDVHGKGMKLVMDCFRNTFEQLDYYGVNMPAEVEVENHLMSTLRENILKPGNLFQFVRYAAAENPQEKSIERFFRILRYQYERKIKGFQARPFARSEANQARPDDKEEYSFEEIVDIVLENIYKYNNDLHTDQKTYPGKSRLDVFLENQHPSLLPMDWQKVARWIGHSCRTSVNRGEVLANNQKFLLPSPELMNETGIGKECRAYWFKHDSEANNTIYLYRNDEFICEMQNKPKFAKARIEQTEADKQAMEQMQSFTRKIDIQAKQVVASLDKVVFIETELVKISTEKAKKVEVFEVPEKEFNYRELPQKKTVNNLIDEL